MSKQTINIGTSPNDKSGDPLRTAFAKVNANFTELYAKAAADATDRLVNGDKELVLNVDSNTPDRAWVDFPPAFGESITIQGSGIVSTDSVIALAGQNRVQLTVLNNIDTRTRLDWNFDSSGTITIPNLLPKTFTAVLDTDHMSFPSPSVALEAPAWELTVSFQVNADSSISTVIDNIFPIVGNPGYVSGYTFDFTEADHGIPEYTISITLDDVILPGGAGWTANLSVTPAPQHPRSLSSNGPLILHGHSTVVVSTGESIHEEQFRFDGRRLYIPQSGDIVDYLGNSVLGGTGGGASVTESDTPPSSPNAGDLWYDTIGGRMYVYFDNTWVDANPMPESTPANELVNGALNLVFNDSGHLIFPAGSEHYDLGAGSSILSHNIDVNGNTWAFNSDASLTLPGDINFTYGGAIFEGGHGISGRGWRTGLNIVGSQTNTSDPIRIYPAGGDGKGFNMGAINVKSDRVEIYGNLQNDSIGTFWTFGHDGRLQLPANGNIVDSNGGDILAGYLKSDGTGLIYGSRLVFVNGHDSDLVFQTGQTGWGTVTANSTEGFGLKSTGGIAIHANDKNWTFGTDGTTSFPDGSLFQYGNLQPSVANGVVGMTSYDGNAVFDVSNAYGPRVRTWSTGRTNEYDWGFGTDGGTTFPGDLHGPATYDLFENNVNGHTLNIAPAADASNKKFGFRIDQFGQPYTRAYLDMPQAEVDHQVAINFPHANNTNGMIFTQGANTYDDGMNNAFNIFYNQGDIKITAETSGGDLKTWKFGNDGQLTFPGGGSIHQYGGSGRLTIDGTGGDGYVQIDGTASILIGSNSTADVVLGNSNVAASRVDIISNKFRIINVDVPEHSTGASGDMVGMIALDGDFIYYCKADYTDGNSDIWVRVAWTSTSW